MGGRGLGLGRVRGGICVYLICLFIFKFFSRFCSWGLGFGFLF